MASRVLEHALRKLRKSSTLPGAIDSSEFAQIRRSIRERAVFSAKVTKAKILEGIKATTQQVLAKEISPLAAREKIRAIVEGTKYKPPAGKEGTIEDLGSDARLDLIVRTNRDMARGYGKFVEAQSSMAEFPYWELYRAEPRLEPRDWPSRWSAAGGQLLEGKMMAPVNDAIWTSISAFGNPYPPFDFNSGMSVRRVSVKRVKAMGLPIPKQRKAKLNGFEYVEGELPRDPDIAKQLLMDLGPGYEVKGGKIVRGA